MAIEIDRLTLGEVAKIEELSGQPIGAFGDEDKPKGLALAAFAFVAKRRQDPKFTWNAAQELTFEEAQEILGLGDEEQDPTPPASAPTSTPPATSKSAKTRKKN